MGVSAHIKRAVFPLPGGSDGATVKVHPMVGGEMKAPPQLWDRGGRASTATLRALAGSRAKWITLPIPTFLIEHPTAGPILVDTAFDASVAERPRRSLGRRMAAMYKVEMTAADAIPAQLRARGIEPDTVRTVIMTHLHYDHASGIEQFPGATFLVDRAEWDAAGSGAFTKGYRAAHYDRAYDWRYVDFASREIDSYASFGRTVDVLGDGSIRLLSTPGHTEGHMSVLVRLAGGELLITGDAAYARRTIERRLVPLFLADSVHTYLRSLDEIAHYTRLEPDAIVLCGHDPWERAALDRSYT